MKIIPIVANEMATSEREWNQLWTNSSKHMLSGGVKEIVDLLFIIFLCGFLVLRLDKRMWTLSFCFDFLLLE